MTGMRAFGILGWAHIRGHKSEYLAMLAISLALGLVKAFDEPVVFDRFFLPHHFDYLRMTLQFRIIRGVLEPLLAFSIPGLFLYTVISDRKSGRNLLTYQLPCRNALPLFVTLITVLFMGCMILLFGRAVYTAFMPVWFSFREIKIFSKILLLCGIICALEGLLCVVKTNRLLLGFVFFIVVMICVISLNEILKDFFLNHYRVYFGDITLHKFLTMHSIFPGCAGLLFAAAGLALTERYRDL